MAGNPANIVYSNEFRFWAVKPYDIRVFKATLALVTATLYLGHFGSIPFTTSPKEYKKYSASKNESSERLESLKILDLSFLRIF